jgi:uncharacterized cofD-like protein
MQRLLNIFKWLYPGMRVKRWLVLMAPGVLLMVAGLFFALGPWISESMVGLAILVLTHHGLRSRRRISGRGCCAGGGRLRPGALRDTADRAIHQRRAGAGPHGGHQRTRVPPALPAHGQRIVVIGGGTGLSTMLRGLKRHSSNLAAIVTVSDDGGSSGRLVREYNVLPPGDIRNCLVALADNEDLMTDLFQYRFGGEGDVSGHTFGNLLLLAMTGVTGNFDEAIRKASRVLAIRGRVLPSTLERVTLTAEMADGKVVHGETAISAEGTHSPICQVSLDPPNPEALPEAVQAILEADAVIIGPGSVYTSIAPNLLVPGLRDALRSTKAVRIYVCNVMTQPGETDGFSASDHVRAIVRHGGSGLFDTVLVNTAMPGEESLRRYAAQRAHVVRPDSDCLLKMGYRPMAANFLNESNLVRHDPQKLADAIMEIIS